MYNFKHMTFLCMQQLTNFPYIEEDFDALTNYELLCKVVEYLNKVIENENLQNDAINTLANNFNNLKDYVENFFDNLDVQEEINNKLDEMAESGELTDIIAQYLGLAGIIGFDTVNDMKEAQNLVNGSKCQTLGYSNIKDGKGSLYRVRTITNEDVVDNDNIIALYNNTLIAEKIEKFIKYNNCLIKITKLENNSNYNFILSRSYDGINFEKITVFKDVTMSGGHNSAMNFCYTHNRFYLLTSLGYWYSEDLINWSEMQTFNVSISGASIYNDKLYGHYKESNTSITNVIGGTTYPYSIKSYDVTFNDDGTLTLTNEETLLEGDSTHSYIDPDVKEYKNNTYLAFKDEVNLCIKLYKFNNGNLEDTNFVHRGIGIEACKLIPTDTALYIYADPYHLQTNYNSTLNINFPRALSVRMTAIDNETVNTDALLTGIHGYYDYHPAFNIISDLKAINIINSLPFTPVLETNVKIFRNTTLPSTENNTVVSTINHPLYLINLYGDTANKIAYLRFTKIFENSPAYISFDKSIKGIIHPAEGVNDNTTSSSTDILLKQSEIFEATVNDKTTGSFIYLLTEGKGSSNILFDLPTDQSIFTSLNQYFTKNYTVNYFKIDGYNKDTAVTLLPTASNFYGTYYRQDANNAIVMLYRQGNVIREYRTTISGGTIAEWTTIHQ